MPKTDYLNYNLYNQEIYVIIRIILIYKICDLNRM